MLTPASLNPVTRFVVATCKPTAAPAFTLVHDLDEATWTRLFNRWLAKSKRHDMNSLWCWIKDRKPHCICLPKAEYDRLTADKCTPATEAEWLAQNN